MTAAEKDIFCRHIEVEEQNDVISQIGAGLPQIYAMLSAEKSYSERLFIYKEIGSLKERQALPFYAPAVFIMGL